MKIITITFDIALTLYLAATVIGAVEFFKGSRTTARIMLWVTAAGFAVHTVATILRYVLAGHLPVANLHEASAFFAWCIILLFFLLEFRYRVGLLGSFILPIAFVIMLSSSFLPREIKPLSPILQSQWFGVHVFFAFLGDAAFAMAAGTGVMYLVQEHFVRSRHLGDLFHRMPSLHILDEINYRLIGLGFVLLSLGMVTGMIWAQNASGTYWRWDPKEVWSLVTWFIYALVLHVRLVQGWRGRKAAGLAILGFAAVLFTLFGVNLILKGFHAFV